MMRYVKKQRVNELLVSVLIFAEAKKVPEQIFVRGLFLLR